MLSLSVATSDLPCSIVLVPHRQISEGAWKSPDDRSVRSQKRAEDGSRGSDLDILTSPPLSLSDLSSSAGLANWRPASDGEPSGPEQDLQPSMTFRNRILDELPSRRPSDKSVSAEVRLVITAAVYMLKRNGFKMLNGSAIRPPRLQEKLPVLLKFLQAACFLLLFMASAPFQAAERDWEEKRASLTQFSAQDINRLLEETQAELMKAIPDLDFAARQINKPAVPPKPQITIPLTSTSATSALTGNTGPTAATNTTAAAATSGGDQQLGKVQLAAQKLNSMEGALSHRGSSESAWPCDL